jgi:hypothetical protein
MAVKTKERVLDLPVEFKNVTIGDTKCSIGVKVGRTELKLGVADKNLCERRLNGSLIAKPRDQRADQATLPGVDDDTRVDGCFDVKSFKVSGDTIDFSLSFAIKDVEIEALAHFAKKMGRLQVYGVSAIPNGKDEEEEEED